ncbi:hypothetical protein [Pontimicrobium sp. IMCC45349]|uniref:hypothetical protein n=1 Tax=Pontimicrobium sp. IMCC45349 TaxID=3391574 RepID=UPI0039A1C101
MKKQVLGLLIVVFGTISPLIAQSSVNDYKYVIVPNRYDFLNEDNKYQLNALTEFLFNKYGFNAIMKNEQFPQDLYSNSCLALVSNVTKHKGAFKTKLQIELRNCKNELIFSSEIGESREKDYKAAFNLALRDAFKSVEALNYEYKENKEIVSLAKVNINDEQEEIAKLKAELESLKKEQEVVKEVKSEVAPVKVESKVKDISFTENSKQDGNNISLETPKKVHAKETKNYLIAKPITNGYQLLNNLTNNIEYTIHATGFENVFIIKDKSGIIYKRGNAWVREYIEGERTVLDFLDVKF